MKTTILLTAVACLFSLSVAAQQTGGAAQVRTAESPQRTATRQGADGQRKTPEEYNKERVAKIATKLQLDEAKQKELLAIFTNQSKQTAALRPATGSQQNMSAEDRQAMRDKLAKLRTETDAKIKKTLGDEKFKKYQEMLKEEAAQRQSSRQGTGQRSAGQQGDRTQGGNTQRGGAPQGGGLGR